MTQIVDENEIVVHDVDDNAAYNERVAKLMAMIETDPTIRDRMLCEIYIALADFDKMARTMALNGGPIKMLKLMMRGGKPSEE